MWLILHVTGFVCLDKAWPTCIPAVFPHSFWFLFIRNLPKIGWFLRERFVCWRRLWLCNAASTRGGERCDVYGFSWKSCFRFLFQRALLFFFYFPKHNLKNLPSVNALVMLLPQSKKSPPFFWNTLLFQTSAYLQRLNLVSFHSVLWPLRFQETAQWCWGRLRRVRPSRTLESSAPADRASVSPPSWPA